MDDLTTDAVPAKCAKGEPFFRRIDWASFWTATIVSLVVYFLTLGPSVSLEDSGELAVAGDHLGVPHPPGYPTWTMLVWCFARLFSFVTFRGQPTPAWGIALASAVCGAFAAGCTAMLITRSAADILKDARESLFHCADKTLNDLLCWGGGVAGSLIFAFSPVMWSQSTIVEVYALGALFMMLVMLLTYRWMRQPSDKLLWITAFVFGLGLTNYQVLLLSALPLVVILFLRDIALFRDFLLCAIPFGLGAMTLMLGSQPDQPGFQKCHPLTGPLALPNNTLCILSLSLFGIALLYLLLRPWLEKKSRLPEKDRTARSLLTAAVLLGLSVFLLFLAAIATHEGTLTNPANFTLIEPRKYVFIGALVLASVGLSALAAVFGEDSWSSPLRRYAVIGSVVLFFIAAILISTIEAPPPYVRTATAYSTGLYTALFFFGVVLMLLLGSMTPRGICFALPVAVVETAAYLLVIKGAMPGLTHPSTWWFWAPVAFNFILLLLASLALPNGFRVAMTIFAAELGVSFYAYMPIVSDLRNPPMNWGYPRTWEGFKHAITRGQYEKISPTDLFTPRFLQQIGGYFTDLRTQFTLLLAPLGFLPFAACWRMTGTRADEGIRRDRLWIATALAVVAVLFWGIDSWVPAERISDGTATLLRCGALLAAVCAMGLSVAAGLRPFLIALGFTCASVLFVILGHVPAIEQYFDSSRIDKLTIAAMLVLGMIGGFLLVGRQLKDAAERMLRSDNRSEQLTICLVLAGLALFVLAVLAKTMMAVQATGGTLAAAALLLIVVAVCATLLLLAKGHGILGGHRIGNTFDTISQQWLIGTVLNFLVMSVLLIVLANPKGDLQDNFIQKVKFISSHGLFALWIGYGIILALASVNSLLRQREQGTEDVSQGASFRPSPFRAVLMGIALVATIALPLIPIHENYCNDQLVFELGSAEQNGHDYGWQFGNYQLRGADAITEELEADEEPLPNPSFPPAMGPGAVFYGGTDPGRFVPTYMIYSADVRPDVFLITQNALADNTFMSVTRDLYGDQIWIPTPDDSANAFKIYVDEVNSGKRPQNAELKIENGRVQVVGALGVMEINGILCKMIFDHNKPWHDFFVEESYVIPWMYDYMTPHGLIMKINKEPVGPMPRDTIEDDMDFWDWYARRLTRDDRWRRDLPAQKSFSKLRTAIAGLYVARNRYREAEIAYGEARLLYSVSPEANFRMIQDIFLRQGRYEEALAYIDRFCELDPNNDRGPAFHGIVSAMAQSRERLSALLARYQGRTPSVADAIVMAQSYRDIGDYANGAMVLERVMNASGLSASQAFDIATGLAELGRPDLAAQLVDRIKGMSYVTGSPERLMRAIRILASAQQYQKMPPLLELYLKKRPSDWQAWLDYASIRLAQGDKQAAALAIGHALGTKDPRCYEAIEGNQQLLQLANEMMRALDQQPPSAQGPMLNF